MLPTVLNVYEVAVMVDTASRASRRRGFGRRLIWEEATIVFCDFSTEFGCNFAGQVQRLCKGISGSFCCTQPVRNTRTCANTKRKSVDKGCSPPIRQFFVRLDESYSRTVFPRPGDRARVRIHARSPSDEKTTNSRASRFERHRFVERSSCSPRTHSATRERGNAG